MLKALTAVAFALAIVTLAGPTQANGVPGGGDTLFIVNGDFSVFVPDEVPIDFAPPTFGQ